MKPPQTTGKRQGTRVPSLRSRGSIKSGMRVSKAFSNIPEQNVSMVLFRGEPLQSQPVHHAGGAAPTSDHSFTAVALKNV